MCIITSLNLYEFSQVNNNEMGILIQRSEDGPLYKDAYEEAQRIIRISDEVRISLERVSSAPEEAATATSTSNEADQGTEAEPAGDKLTSSKIAAKLGMKTAQFIDRATEQGFLALDGDKHVMTAKGEKAGVEFVAKSRFGPYFLWPQNFHPV